MEDRNNAVNGGCVLDKDAYRRENEPTPEQLRLWRAMDEDQDLFTCEIQNQEHAHRCEVARMSRMERIRRHVVAVVRKLVTLPRILGASSAEAASRHKQDDDSGGGDDPDDSDPSRRRHSAVADPCPLAGREDNLLERIRRNSLVTGGEVR
jgi:hypothetical protein